VVEGAHRLDVDAHRSRAGDRHGGDRTRMRHGHVTVVAREPRAPVRLAAAVAGAVDRLPRSDDEAQQHGAERESRAVLLTQATWPRSMSSRNASWGPSRESTAAQ
jgi:hypothetical protein